MKKLYPFIAICIGFFFLAFSGAPNDVRTEAPGDNQTCQNCHGFSVGDGSLVITGVPDPIVKGETYPITVTLTDPGQVEGGFQMVATNGVDNTNVGTFTDTGEIRIISSGTAAGRVTQSSPKSFGGGNSTSWTFDWTAPDAPTSISNIKFFAVGNAVNGNNSTSGDFVYFDETDAIALPVEWAFVEAQKANDGIMISWATFSEINNEYFEIEKSQDGKNFEVIGRQEASRNSSTLSEYKFLDADAVQGGIHYYRIKQVDLDGRFDYSSIISQEIHEKGEYAMYPNPSSGQLTIESDTEKVLTIFDASGMAVRKEVIRQDIETLDISSFQNGTYYVMDEQGNFKILIKN